MAVHRYAGNRISGRYMLAAAFLALVVNPCLWALLELPEKDLATWMAHVLTALLVTSCLFSYPHVRKL